MGRNFDAKIIRDNEVFKKKYNSYYSGRLARDLFELKRRTRLEMVNDDSTYTIPQDLTKKSAQPLVIHIGMLQLPVNDGDDDSAKHPYMRWLLAHEGAHQKYTTARAWESALEQSYKNFIRYAYVNVTGKNPRLTTDSSYDQALEDLSAHYGISLNPGILRQYIHFLLNSLEDGRIERKESIERPGIGDDIKYCRAKEWLDNPMEDNVDLQNARHKLLVVSNQVLTLATMGRWQRGAIDYIVGTPLEQEILQMLPLIKKSVKSRSCKSGMKYAQQVVEAMFPLLLEASKMTQFEQQLTKMLQQMAQQWTNSCSGDPNEDNNSGSNGSQYNASEKQDSEWNKEDEAEEDSSSGKPGASNGQSGPGAGSESEEDDEGFDIFKSSGSSSSSEESDEASASNGGDNAGQGQGDEVNESESSDSNKKTAKPGGKAGSKGQSASGKGDDVEVVMAAMKYAAENVSRETEHAQNVVRSFATSTGPTINDNSMAEDAVPNIKELCPDFNEFSRQYEVDIELPYDIQQECQIERRKYEAYFTEKRRPVKRGCKSGSIDAHALSRFMMGDTDIYKRKGITNTFSGCIEVRLDNSGSMSGEKKMFACETLARIEELLKGLVPLKITSFDCYSNTDIEIIKNWNEKLPLNCSWNFYEHSRDGGGTPTAEALLTAEHELLARPERRKLLILLTDENASCCGNNLQSMIREIRSQGIQLCAIYFDEYKDEADRQSFVNLFDNQDAIACDPSEISKYLLPVIKKFCLI